MKTILFMTISADGKTTGKEDDVNWISESDVERMDSLLIECGVMIMGSKTYESFGEYLPNAKALLVVMTKRQELLNSQVDNVIFTDETPQEVLDTLSKKGFATVMLCGGQELNTSFLAEKLLDEVWLICKPVVLGEGKSLFTKSMPTKLHLITREELEDGAQEVKYEVVG